MTEATALAGSPGDLDDQLTSIDENMALIRELTDANPGRSVGITATNGAPATPMPRMPIDRTTVEHCGRVLEELSRAAFERIEGAGLLLGQGVAAPLRQAVEAYVDNARNMSWLAEELVGQREHLNARVSDLAEQTVAERRVASSARRDRDEWRNLANLRPTRSREVELLNRIAALEDALVTEAGTGIRKARRIARDAVLAGEKAAAAFRERIVTEGQVD